MFKISENLLPRSWRTSPWSLRHDDFSVQCAIEGDPMFWIRAEKGHVQPVILSDFQRSRQTPDRLAGAMDAVISEILMADQVSSVLIKDLVPKGAREDAEAEAAQIALALAPYGALIKKQVREIQVVERDTKFDLWISFA